MDHIGIGLIGYGMIGRVHALAYRELPLYYPGALPPIKLAAIATARAETAQRAAAEAGFESYTTDLDELLSRDDVNVVDVAAPNYAHRPIVLAAIRAGKHVLVEKPLALNAREALEIAEAAREAGARVGLIFNFRFIPAVLRARQLIESGFVGPVYQFHTEYLHTGYQNPERPIGWKLRRAQSGGGALTDLGSHNIDMMRYLLGDYEEVLATTHTYISERPVAAGSSQRERVDVEDAAWVQVKMQSGALGTIAVSRFATGAVDDLGWEIYGERGALRFSLMDANWLYAFDAGQPDQPLGGKRGWTRLETIQHYPGAAAPPGRSIIGWTRALAQNIYDFLLALTKDTEPAAGLSDGVRVNQFLDAAYASAAGHEWIRVVT